MQLHCVLLAVQLLANSKNGKLLLHKFLGNKNTFKASIISSSEVLPLDL